VQVAPVASLVHDQATVTSSDAAKTPTGSVTFAWFAGNLHCSSRKPTSLQTVALAGGAGVTTTESSSVGLLAAGDYSYRAQYVPDAAARELGFVPTTSACEQLRIQ
jgi:hypothetical protein